jgi:hypothetical protein
MVVTLVKLPGVGGLDLDSGEEVRAHLNTLHEAVWELAAIALGLRDPSTTDTEPRRSAEQVLVEAGLMVESATGPRPVRGVAEAAGGDQSRLAAQAATAILQSAALLSGASAWTSQDDAAILAQGRASAQGAQAFKAFAVPMMEGLGELLSGSSPVMLDVGVGVAAMAVAFCEAFPGLRVVGLDVFPRALELAQRTIEQAGMVHRIEVRHENVAGLNDREVFSLGWLPAPFVPRAAIEVGLPRMVAALVPGGWLVVGHGKFADQGLSGALTRFQTVVFGGAAINGDEVQNLLREVGLQQVATLPTPEGTPGITVGRRPARS